MQIDQVTGEHRFICGGTLISSKHILTGKNFQVPSQNFTGSQFSELTINIYINFFIKQLLIVF